MHGQYIMGVMELISDTYLAEKLVAAPVSVHYNMRVAIDGNFKLKEDLRLFLRSIRYVIYIVCFFGDEAFAHSLVFTFHPTKALNHVRNFH